jgi:hypothetical protein
MPEGAQDPPNAVLRAVPLEALREFTRSRTDRTSMREVARQIGVARTTLSMFVNHETTPHPRIRRMLALWYLRESGAAQADVDACEVLLLGLPPELREDAVRELQDFVSELHAKHRREPI